MKVQKFNFEKATIDLLNLGHQLKQSSSTYKNRLMYEADVKVGENTTQHVVLFDQHMLYLRMMNYHYNKQFIFHVDRDEYTSDVMLPLKVLSDYFMPLWDDFKLKNSHGWDQMLEGWYYHYNPTENYFRVEDSQTTYLGKEVNEFTKEGKEINALRKSGKETTTISKQGKEVNEVTYSGSETETNNLGERDSSSESGKNPYDGSGSIGDNGGHPITGGNSGYLQESKSLDHSEAVTDSTTTTFTNRKDKNELSFEDDRKDTSTVIYGDGSTEGARLDESELSFDRRMDTSTKTFDRRSDGFHSDIHGNVGVTESSKMVEDEIALRLKSLQDAILDEFINTYCIYIDSDM